MVKSIPLRKFLCMTNDQIEKFLEPEHIAKNVVRINFKTRNTILGIFINSGDYQDLKSKNFWRIVSETKLDNWKKSRDINLARIFNGAEITKLTTVYALCILLIISLDLNSPALQHLGQVTCWFKHLK